MSRKIALQTGQAPFEYLEPDVRYCYAAWSPYGVGATHDYGWVAYAFTSRAERADWLDDNRLDRDGKPVAEPVTRRVAYRIAGITTVYVPMVDPTYHTLVRHHAS